MHGTDGQTDGVKHLMRPPREVQIINMIITSMYCIAASLCSVTRTHMSFVP